MGASVLKKPPSAMEQSPKYIKEKVKWGDLLSSTVDRVMMQPDNRPSWASQPASVSSIKSFGVPLLQPHLPQGLKGHPPHLLLPLLLQILPQELLPQGFLLP